MLISVIVLALSLFLITGQLTIFRNVLSGTYAVVKEMNDVDIWVMNASSNSLEGESVLSRSEMIKIQNTEGVKLVAPFFKGCSFIHLGKNKAQKCTVIGVDEKTLLGFPKKLTEGKLNHLALDKAVFIDNKSSKTKLAFYKNGKKHLLNIGHMLNIGNVQSVVVGKFLEGRRLNSDPVVYTSIQRAQKMSHQNSGEIPFILVKAKEGANLAKLCQTIERGHKVKAYTKKDFLKMVTQSYFQKSGIPHQFAWAVVLGFILAIGIMSITIFSICEGLKKDLSIIKTIGASFSNTAFLSMFHTVLVSFFGWSLSVIITFALSMLFSFYILSIQVISMTFVISISLAGIIPIIYSYLVKDLNNEVI